MKKTIPFILSLALVGFAYAGTGKDKAACPKEKSCCCCAKACPDKKAACEKQAGCEIKAEAKGSCTKTAKPAEAPTKA